MNRTHLEEVAATLATKYGYAFFSGPDDCMAQTLDAYPAAWLSPLQLHEIDGRRHGRVTYNLTLHLMRLGATLTPAERAAAMAVMEEHLLALLADLSLDKKVITVEQLSLHPRTFALTPHGEISQTATARIITFF